MLKIYILATFALLVLPVYKTISAIPSSNFDLFSFPEICIWLQIIHIWNLNTSKCLRYIILWLCRVKNVNGGRSRRSNSTRSSEQHAAMWFIISGKLLNLGFAVILFSPKQTSLLLPSGIQRAKNTLRIPAYLPYLICRKIITFVILNYGLFQLRFW